MTKRGMLSTSKTPCATAAGTERFQERVATRFIDDFFRSFAGGLSASSIGIGTYLGECDDADDTSYAGAIREAIEAGTVARDEVIVCTKGGYIPLDTSSPPSREEYLAYLQHTFVDPGIVS